MQVNLGHRLIPFHISYSDNNRMEGSHTNIYELHVYEKEFSIY